MTPAIVVRATAPIATRPIQPLLVRALARSTSVVPLRFSPFERMRDPFRCRVGHPPSVSYRQVAFEDLTRAQKQRCVMEAEGALLVDARALARTGPRLHS